MKKQLLYLILLLYPISIFGQDVSEQLAVQMANHYYQTLNSNTNEQNLKKVKAKIATSEQRLPAQISPLGKAYMWFVPVDDGWVLVSGNTKATPILAHIQSYEMPVYDSLPDAAKDLFNTFEDYIAYIEERPNEYTTNKKWNKVLNSNTSSTLSATETITEVGPLLSVHWDQSGGGSCSANKTYNKFCPIVNSTERCGKAPVGCVAVAIAQIMWYWKWPYSAQVPTTIGGSTTEIKFYDWDKMPEYINDFTPMEEVDMIAGFLRDCGYKLDMNYGANGSSASDNNAVNTLKAFGYDENTINLRSKWNTSGWTNMLRTNIDNGQPVYYSGWSKSVGGDGHAFVVDGYRNGNSPIYHINFGWGGYADGWYNIDDAYVNDSLHFDHSQKAIFGIRPAPPCDDFTFDGSTIPIIFPSKFCVAIGGDLTLANNILENIEEGKLYSSTQIKLQPGTTIKQGSNVHIAIKNIPCQISANAAPAYMPAKNQQTPKVSDMNINSFSVSPSPANDILNITTTEQIEQVRIYNLNGQCMLQCAETKINISSLPSGMYLLYAITANGTTHIQKFIKQ